MYMSFPYSSFIVSDRDVNSLTEGYDETDDNKLSTMANTHNHILEQISTSLTNYVPIPSDPTAGAYEYHGVLRNATNTGWEWSQGKVLTTIWRTSSTNGSDVYTAGDEKIPSILGLKTYAVPITIPSFSVSKTALGRYTITFGSTLANSNYVIMLTLETVVTGGGTGGTAGVDDYMIVYHSKSTSGFGVYIKEQDDSISDGVFRDSRFDFLCSYRGHIFCQGSINGFSGTAYPV